MLHLYIITRGIKNSVDQFITELQGKYLPFKWRRNKDSPMQNFNVQVAVRPIQLWEIVFPEEHKDLMLTTVLGKDFKGKTQHRKHDKFVFGLRKILGVEKIGDFKTDAELPITRQAMEVVGVGIKKDYWQGKNDRKNKVTDEDKKEYFEAL